MIKTLIDYHLTPWISKEEENDPPIQLRNTTVQDITPSFFIPFFGFLFAHHSFLRGFLYVFHFHFSLVYFVS